MRQKLADYEYMNFEQFEADFNLMIQNCLSFNHEDTLYYRAALRMRTQCKTILKTAHKRIKQACIDPQTGIHAEQPQPAAADETTPEEGFSINQLSICHCNFSPFSFSTKHKRFLVFDQYTKFNT